MSVLEGLSSYGELLQILPDLRPEEHRLFVNLANRSVAHFQDGVRDAEGLIADFDGTLNVGSQWITLRSLMNKEALEGEKRDLDAYLARSEHSNVEDARFILNSIERLCGVGLRKGDIEELAQTLPPRAGACELVRSFEPDAVAVVSFGIYDFIRHWFGHHAPSCRAEIFALHLVYEEHLIKSGYNAQAVGYDLSTLVSDGNKGYCRDVFCAARRIDHRRVLAIGDAPTDINMMDPANVGVLVIPKIDPQPGRMEYRLRGLEAMWPRLAGVLVSDSLMPLVALRRSAIVRR